jgi:hypothetical protein
LTGDDLIVAAPWLAFAAGLAVIAWRLAVGRRRRGPPPRGSGTGRGLDGAGEQRAQGGSVAQNGWRRDR